MKNLCLLFILTLCSLQQVMGQDRPFITTWNAGASNTIILPVDDDFTYDFRYTWSNEDGTVIASGSHTSADGPFETVFTESGTYRLSVTGEFPRFYNYPKDQLLDVEQWGDIPWKSMYRSFRDWPGMEFSAEDVPNLSEVENMRGMFSGASSFNDDVSAWDVSQATNMRGMFSDASSFNGDVSNWEVGNVTNMRNMFRRAISFNRDIGGWEVSQVTDMRDMISGSGLSAGHYDRAPISWADQEVQDDVIFGAEGITYCDGAAAREQLIADHDWTINDGGLSCAPGNRVIGTLESGSGPDREDVTWRMYPNPVSNLLYLEVQKEKEVKVSITDLGGRQVVSEKAGSHFELDLSGLTPGVYLLMVREGEKLSARKIIVR